jgi:DUF2075 family protein/phage repressor protein C with HTH and peptisase S24 domain/predicted GIY-YIG superfamily endonuclease
VDKKIVKVEKHSFSNESIDIIQNDDFVENLWPLVYILSNQKTQTAYVGETTDTKSRMKNHLKHEEKNQLDSLHLITSKKFNKSATLDIESNLIKYMSGDNKFKLLNGNLGLANHNYYQKNEVYWEIFEKTWNQLRGIGITEHSLEEINNSDLFKYSPYKSLSQEQTEGLIEILKSIADDSYDNVIINGGAGTGKSILAIFILKLLTSEENLDYSEFGETEFDVVGLVQGIKMKFPQNPKMALVIPMSSFRTTLKKVFGKIKGLKASMVISPSEASKKHYDLLLVDEAHRLRKRVNLGSYFRSFDDACNRLELDKMTSTEVDWILKQSNKAVFFYDEMQSIKPSDADKEAFSQLKGRKSTSLKKLKSQFRIEGGNSYVEFIHDLLNCKFENNTNKFESDSYDFLLFENIDEMVETIKSKNDIVGLSRLVAGFAWKWKSKNDPEINDIEIEDTSLKWNSTASDWINSSNAVNEVGCIHTVQGYDLNYAGIIFGNEISYDPKTQNIIVKKDNYFDRNGKATLEDPEELKAYILNIYKTMMFRGIKGAFIYACDKGLREYFKSHIPLFINENKNSENIFIEEEIEPYVNAVPLYDLKVAAGEFGDAQQVENFEWVRLPENISPNEDLFACQVIGESMNEVIPNGSICLFSKATGGSRSGKIVLVENTNRYDEDFGSCYTVKEYSSRKIPSRDQWEHESITLKPLSLNPNYEDIVLTEEDLQVLRIIGIFIQVL